ncbi:cilia- and flagella-associated protein 77-like [Halichondria panicea]|uniref:cilia- and flagella-associated protein 77-like n=1 Tax=Halichondria panicea TaxID=6063 RepID=UPI00312B68EE
MSRKEMGALGSQRESLSSNPLLMASEVGKPRRRGFTLPNATFTYGIRTENKDGGASEAMSNWHAHRPSAGIKKIPQRDFIALNKRAICSGLTTAQEQTQYRATHNIWRRDDTMTSEKNTPKFSEMTFGMSTRPSTPIFDLMENKYQEAWLQERREYERKQREKMLQKKLQDKKVYETRASLMRHYSEPVASPPLWKMTRWAEIEPQLQTFRSEKERSVAFHQHSLDATSRVGVFGHGIYQAAQS